MIKQFSNIISLSRVIWAIIFYVLITQVSFVDERILLLFFALIELSDFLDGMVARLFKITSDVGKLLDPICDITAHFLCLFALYTLYMVPTGVVIIFIIREIWITFLRALLIRKNIIFAARWTGKLKTCVYAIAILLSIVLLPQSFLVNMAPHASKYLLNYLPFLYYAGATLSILSGFNYAIAAFNVINNNKKQELTENTSE